MVFLQADWVLPINGPPIRNGAVIVRHGTIDEVGDAGALRRERSAEQTLEFPGCILMPGIVNTHTHLEYSAFRGLMQPSGFGRWMLGLLRARRKLDLEDYAASALWGALECVRNGVTSIADTTYEGWIVGRAARAAGLRARVYVELFGLDDTQAPATLQRLEERLARLREECGRTPAAARDDVPEDRPCLVEPGVSPHAPYTVSARLYREAARFARRSNLRLATHLAESQAEVDLLIGKKSPIARAYQAANLWTGQNWTPPAMRPVPYLAQTGALGPGTLAIHVVQADSADVAALAATGAGVAHCPRSNLRLRCGGAPVAEMLAAGIAVGLGTDSLASNDDLDMFSEMRAALAVSRARAEAGAPLPPLTPSMVLRMATLEGARALGQAESVGSIEPGKRADLIAVRLHDANLRDHASPAGDGRGGEATGDPVARLVETARALDVRMTMIDGQVVFDAGTSGPPSREVAGGLTAARAKLGLPG